MNQDNFGTVRPRHVRKFKNGLADMIIENGLSRIFLGVHWFFDAFALRRNNPDLSQEKIGGVPLGLNIAADIFAAGGGLAPKFSTTGPKAQKCISDTGKERKEAQRDFHLGISER
jgi:vanadium chloroperoxidase